jgi:hypothetical protein
MSFHRAYEYGGCHLNKTNHKVSFSAIRDNVGSTTFAAPQSTFDMQHSCGVPRLFFRFNMTSAISQQPYGYVHWSMFKISKRHEWTTGPIERLRISPFCYI